MAKFSFNPLSIHGSKNRAEKMILIIGLFDPSLTSNPKNPPTKALIFLSPHIFLALFYQETRRKGKGGQGPRRSILLCSILLWTREQAKIITGANQASPYLGRAP